MSEIKKDFCTLTDMERRSLILIRRGLCHSRAELSRALSISRPTASLIVESLLALRALCETGTGKSVRGKSPIILSPVSDYQYTIGLDLGYTKQLAGVLVDGRNRIIRKAETDFDPTSIAGIRENALKIIRQLSSGYGIGGIGIALSGIVEPKTGKVLRSVNPLFASCDFKTFFMQETGYPVLVENRARSAAFSEAFGGAANQKKNFILCSLGRSIGSAFWLNGTIFPGTHGEAGEIRVLRLADGKTLEEALSPENVSKYTGDKLVSICTEGLSQLTQIMDLELVVLTGRFINFGADFLKKLEKRLSSQQKIRVVFSRYGRFSAARGAAVLMAEQRIS